MTTISPSIGTPNESIKRITNAPMSALPLSFEIVDAISAIEKYVRRHRTVTAPNNAIRQNSSMLGTMLNKSSIATNMINAIPTANASAKIPPTALPLIISSRYTGCESSDFNERLSFSLVIKSNPIAIASIAPRNGICQRILWNIISIEGFSGI
ncbi:hypothetical protein ES705_26808 [subsurface metagenome]